MIIDMILDRQDGSRYSAHDFYFYCYGNISNNAEKIMIAMDYGTEKDVKKALCDYITDNEYNPKIMNHINSVNWL